MLALIIALNWYILSGNEEKMSLYDSKYKTKPFQKSIILSISI